MSPRDARRHIAVVAGTRPEIIKLAAVTRLLGPAGRLVHTGQHTDHELSGIFLAAAGLTQAAALAGPTVRGVPRPAQVGRMVEQLGTMFTAAPPAAVIVQGDTNTACAAAQAANFCGVPVVHVEAGLRSFDRAMPEEINRCLIGVLADVHCAPTPRAVAHLAAEGVPREKILLTGNTVVEATRQMLPPRRQAREIAARYGAEPGGYVLATVHRPENTDDPGRLEAILTQLAKLGLPVLAPLHPRTRAAITRFRLEPLGDQLRLVPPADHQTFLALASMSRLIVSDSGGVQEECTVIKRPLIVVRNSTERPESIEAGFACLVPPGPQIGAAARRLIADRGLAARLAAAPCPYGDGRASERIVSCARRFLA